MSPCSMISFIYWPILIHFFSFFKIFFKFIFRERGSGVEGREMSMFKRYINHLTLTCPQLRTWSKTQACALTGKQTNDLLVHRPALNPLSHTSQGNSLLFQQCVFLFPRCQHFHAEVTVNTYLENVVKFALFTCLVPMILFTFANYLSNK